MFKHQLKLMWNKRRANGLLFLEVLLAFVVLLSVYTFATFVYEQASSPLGFTSEDGLLVKFNWDGEPDSLAILELQERVRREVAAVDGVAAAALLGGVPPFSRNTWQTGNDDNGFSIFFKMFFGDRRLAEAAGLELAEGRWFDRSDESAKHPPVVINRAFQEEYFPGVASLVDTVIYTDGRTRVVGVVEDFKYYSNFAAREPLVFFSQRSVEMDYGAFRSLWVRTAPGRKGGVQENIYRAVAGATNNTNVTIRDLAEARRVANRPTVVPLVVVSLIAAFLLINTALGLFGVLFTQINRRRAEIGLRKALGATAGGITRQFVLEVVLVTVTALLVGSLLAVQVPWLDLLPVDNRFFYYGIFLAGATILFVITLCALLPSLQAARLHPATVLHEE